jgi:hypothetical protein
MNPSDSVTREAQLAVARANDHEWLYSSEEYVIVLDLVLAIGALRADRDYWREKAKPAAAPGEGTTGARSGANDGPTKG